MLTRFIRRKEGQNLIEYAFLATFVSLAAYMATSDLGSALEGHYDAMAGVVERFDSTAESGIDSGQQGAVAVGNDEDPSQHADAEGHDTNEHAAEN